MTDRQRDILRHSLGLNYARKPFRNYFAAAEGHVDLPDLRALVAQGYMLEGRNCLSQDFIFRVTQRGVAALVKKSPAIRSEGEAMDGKKLGEIVGTLTRMERQVRLTPLMKDTEAYLDRLGQAVGIGRELLAALEAATRERNEAREALGAIACRADYLTGLIEVMGLEEAARERIRPHLARIRELSAKPGTCPEAPKPDA